MLKTILCLAALSAAGAGFASADSIQFIGVPTGVNDGYYYDLPYEVAINGVDQLVTCYDVFDDVNFGDQWQANLLTLSQAAATGYFSQNSGALAGYEEIAWLDAQAYNNTTQQIGLQYAIWSVFGSYASTAASQSYLAQAQAAAASGYQGFSFADARFIEQIGGVAGQNGTEQAFVFWETTPTQWGNIPLATPEPAAFLLMLLGAAAILGLHRLLHRCFEQRVIRVGVRRTEHLP